ncbi:glycosyltransferase [Nocardioides marinquilinus]|uniref:Glycosyltransferase n=1 Tax=Nocardioides marinquilinus TaxID=1210400 RepID=A0ABP9PHP2_9ACTN
MAVSPGAAVTAAGTALSLASVGLVLDNLRRMRVPRLDAGPTGDTVAVLLPARDEAARVGACVRSLVAAARHHGDAGVVVLDDGSSDGTAALAREAGADEVLAGAPTPAGWAGKPWACAQLAAAADDADVLLFVDADVVLDPAAVSATVHLLRATGLDLVCPYPRQQAGTPSERLVQPLLQWSWLSTLPLGLAERSARPSLGAANGQLLAVDAAAYRRAGGHGAVRDEVLEDLALLRAVKAAGGRGVVADGTHVATCRMYGGAAELRAGYRKSLWAAFGSPAGAAGVVGLLTLTHVVPPVAALAGSRVGALGYAASVAGRALAARRTGGRVLPDVLAHPLAVLAFGGLVADSWVGRRRGRLTWKGRAVPWPARQGRP